MIRVLIVDDQPLLRHSLALLLGLGDDIAVVGQAADGAEGLVSARELRPDVVLMDIRMPKLDGIAATRAITDDPALADCRVLVLTMFDLDEYVFEALAAGASGFLLKDAEPNVLLDAVRRTAAGESLFAPTVLRRLVANFVARPKPPPKGQGESGLERLTARERDVLTLVAQGLSNDEIAGTLFISIKTVKTHIGNLLSKLHARDRAQLVIAAYQARLVA